MIGNGVSFVELLMQNAQQYLHVKKGMHEQSLLLNFWKSEKKFEGGKHVVHLLCTGIGAAMTLSKAHLKLSVF